MTDYPRILVDDVDLSDKYGRWGLRPTQPMPGVPGIRAHSVEIPGRSGVLTPLFDAHDAAVFGVHMWIFGRGGKWDDMMADRAESLFTIQHLMSVATRLDYRHSPDPLQWMRAEDIRLTTASESQRVNMDAVSADFVFEIPSGVWRAPAFEIASHTGPLGVNAYQDFDVPFLSGSTGAVSDLSFLARGPFTKLDVIDAHSHHGFSFNKKAASGEWFRIRCGDQVAEQVSGADWVPVRGRDKVMTGSVSTYSNNAWQGWLDANPRVRVGQPRRGVRLRIHMPGSNANSRLLVRGRRVFR